MPLSPTNVLPFAYFQIDVPQDVDFNQSLVSANAFGNNWRAYPANSQAEFDGIVKAKAQKLYDEKLDEKTIAWNRRNIEDDASVNDERKKPRLLTDLKMTRRLYKVFKVDNQRYSVISTVDDYTLNVTAESYWYIPDQKQYLYTRTDRLPSKDVANIDEAQKMINKYFSFWEPMNARTLANQYSMALGHVMWVSNINEQPHIKYNLRSKILPVDIDLESQGFSNDGVNSNKEAKRIIEQWMENGHEVFRRSKAVAGLDGTEFCFFVPEDDVGSEAYYWCGFITKGMKANLMQPAIELSMRYRTTNEATAKAAWHQLINSLKTRGSPNGSTKV